MKKEKYEKYKKDIESILDESSKDKIEQPKKENHFVWAFYLKGWINSGGTQIAWLEKRKKLEMRNPDSVAKERYFYKIKEMNDIDKKIVCDIIATKPQHIRQCMLDAVMELQRIFIWEKFSCNEKLLKVVDKRKKEDLENIHTKIEANSEKYLRKLREGNYEFLNNKDDKETFYEFIAWQLLRTKKFQDQMSVALRQNREVFEQGCYQCFNEDAVVQAWAVCEAIDKADEWKTDNYNVQIIENGTLLNFITGDAPVVGLGLTQRKSIIYYPVSPKLAILISKEVNHLNIVKANIDTIKIYNDEIVKSHHEQLYASNLIDLFEYIVN